MDYVSFPPATLLNPTPVVLVSCAEKDHPENRNLVTVAWAGTVNSEPPMVSVSLRKSRYSHDLILNSGEYVVNLVDESMCKAVDFCGVRSGRDLDKAASVGLTYCPAEGMSVAPAVDGAPLSLSCRVRQVLELGSHDLFLGEVKAIRVRKDLLDEKGSLRLEKAALIAYNHGLYQSLGNILGFFGWSVARPDVLARRMRSLQSV
ncbi:MAG: flavin reductase family protein [Clostridia bacterium]|nr:flavin reductase family protein [Clostridia bacterium]